MAALVKYPESAFGCRPWHADLSEPQPYIVPLYAWSMGGNWKSLTHCQSTGQFSSGPPTFGGEQGPEPQIHSDRCPDLPETYIKNW
jgi:hypothetical protein